MSSIIKVDTIQDQDGNNIINENANTITIGKSGDTVTVAAGATFVGGGIEWQSTIVTTSTLTAVAGKGYWIDTTSNACTVTLPASASAGDQLIFTDYARTWGTNAVTIDQNSLNFQGNTSPNPIYNTSGQSVNIVYSGATQGWVPNSDDNVTLETPQAYSIDFLVVAGGGSGGGNNGGGAGAGGYRTSTQSITAGNTITVTVGGGGASKPYTSPYSGNKGTDSSISGTGLTTVTSAGGGGGVGAGETPVGRDGGSGGGGSRNAGTQGSGNTPSTSPSQGNDGGDGASAPSYGGGGGGGAGAVGSAANASNGGGDGGTGTTSSITGSSVTYAGGGGGSFGGVGTGGSGGAGGGTAGTNNTPSGNGTANTGGGSGGLNNTTNGSGGSGVVILSMPDADYSTTTTGSPTVATGVSGKTVLTFTGSGSYTT
jgi:hypothetical protein